MPEWALRLDRSAVTATRILALIGLFGLLVLACATILDVLLRYLFNSPIDGQSDVAQLVVIFMVTASFPASLAGRHQITIRFLGKAAPWRMREALELFGHVLMLLVFVGLAWRLVLYTQDLYANGQTTWLLAIPLWPSWTISTILVILCVPIQAIVVLIQALRLAAPEEPAAGAPGDTVHSDELDVDEIDMKAL